MQEPTLETAIDLFNQQSYFECHEVLEDLWQPLAAGAQKTFLQGLIQVAVGLHHLRQGNFVGARNKLEEGLQKLNATAESDWRTEIELGLLINQLTFAYHCLLELGPERMAQFPFGLSPQIHWC